jgi:hypothetical protein
LFVAGALSGGMALSRATAQAEASGPDPRCPRCSGVGRVPIAGAKPFVWLKGTPLPKPETIVDEQYCPTCQKAKAGDLAADLRGQIDAALEKNKQWEERTGWKLGCIITRHAAVHTQLTTAQARTVGQALETLTMHLKQLTDSLLLVPTRPDTLELMMLWEKKAWDQFRKVMEDLYPREKLGPSWASAQLWNAYDHSVTPHTYETPQSIKIRPPSCGAVFIAGRRQLNVATDWHAPFWLAEGFSGYCDNVVHKTNRWYSVYDVKQIPVGDWLADARKLAADSKLRPWKEMMARELRDWETSDHVQTTGAVAFLIESEPAKFLRLVARLRGGEEAIAALEAAYGVVLDELEQRFSRWLLARR